VVKDIKKFFPKSRVSNLSKLYYTSLTDKKYYLNNSTYCYFFIKDGWENKYNFKKFLSKNYTWNGLKSIRDDVLTPNIWWFRK